MLNPRITCLHAHAARQKATPSRAQCLAARRVRGKEVFEVVLAMALIVGSSQVARAPDADAVVPGFRGKIAYSKGSTSSDIFTIDPDGTGAQRLTTAAAYRYDRGPAWSPDGTRIAFASDRSGSGHNEIFVMNADGTQQRQITSSDYNSGAPAWSPDGRRMSFVRGGPGTGVYLMDADGSNVEPLGLTLAATPKWSPDGASLAYVYYPDNNHRQLRVRSLDGSSDRLLLSTGDDIERPDWSPDGASLVFIKAARVAAINADGSGLRDLAGDQSACACTDHSPAWSPDGTEIAWVRFGNGGGGLYLMGIDGSGKRLIAEHTNTYSELPKYLAWQTQPVPSALIEAVTDPVNAASAGVMSAAGSARWATQVRVWASDGVSSTPLRTLGISGTGDWSLADLDVSALSDGELTVHSSVTSAFGHVANAARTLTKDTVAPEITAVRTPPPNTDGWNSGDVDVAFTCADATSVVTACPGSIRFQDEGSGQGATVTATDTAGNTSTVTVSGINIDRTTPATTITSASRAIAGTATDALSGARDTWVRFVKPGKKNGVDETRAATCLSGCGTGFALWSASSDGLPTGKYTVTAWSSDVAGNVGPPSPARIVRIGSSGGGGLTIFPAPPEVR